MLLSWEEEEWDMPNPNAPDMVEEREKQKEENEAIPILQNFW